MVGNTGQASSFSDIATFEIGLLSQNDWDAEWIGGGDILEKGLSSEIRTPRPEPGFAVWDGMIED